MTQIKEFYITSAKIDFIASLEWGAERAALKSYDQIFNENNKVIY